MNDDIINEFLFFSETKTHDDTPSLVKGEENSFFYFREWRDEKEFSHREGNKPALIIGNYYQTYNIHGKLHRIGKPARILKWYNGVFDMEWWEYGRFIGAKNRGGILGNNIPINPWVKYENCGWDLVYCLENINYFNIPK